MSAVQTAPPMAETYTRWAEVDIGDMPFLEKFPVSSRVKTSTSPMAIYRSFLVASVLLAVFFAISLVLALTTQYFIDWGSALVGFLGTAGLSVVAWFSKKEAQS